GSVLLWAGGFAAELRDDAAALSQARRRLDKNPLGSAAGYGTPGLPVDREATRTALGFAAVQEPVTAVQLSRGKGEAQLIFEIALLMQDLEDQRSEEHTSELQSLRHLVCRLLLEKKKQKKNKNLHIS